MAWLKSAHAKFASFIVAPARLAWRSLARANCAPLRIAPRKSHRKIGAVQQRAGEVGLAQIGAHQVRVAQIGAREDAALQIGVAEIDMGQHQTLLADEIDRAAPQPRPRRLAHEVDAVEDGLELLLRAMVIPMLDAVVEQPAMLLRRAQFDFRHMRIERRPAIARCDVDRLRRRLAAAAVEAVGGVATRTRLGPPVKMLYQLMPGVWRRGPDRASERAASPEGTV